LADAAAAPVSRDRRVLFVFCPHDDDDTTRTSFIASAKVKKKKKEVIVLAVGWSVK
jgi:hypothetical protein